MRPRGRGAFLLGAVWLIVLTQESLSLSWSKSSQDLQFHNALTSGDVHRLINEQIDIFRVELIQGLSTPLSGRRNKRAVLKTSEVTDMNQIPSIKVRLNSTLGNPDMSCFLYNGTHYCVVGDTLYSVSDGHFEHILSGFPVQEGDQIRTFVYQNIIYFAFFNKKTAHLRLRQLQGPNATKLKFIQNMSADKLEDCLFFEHSGNLYMALAVQLGPDQYAQNVGMQCIIYQWLGTTMDMIHKVTVENLERIVLFPATSEETYLLFIQTGYKVQLWQLNEEVEYSLLIHVVDIGITRLNQVHNLTVADQDCMLFGGNDQSVIYCLIGEKLLRWQTLDHYHPANPYAWLPVQQLNVSGSDVTSLLIFHSHNPELQSNRYDFYYSNSSGLFSMGLTEEKPTETGCVPQISVAFSDSTETAQLIQTCYMNESTILQGYTLLFSESSRDDPPPDPLVQCLSEINSLIEKLDEIGDVSDIEKNLLTVDDDFVTNGTVTVEELSYIPPELGPIHVIFDPNEEYNTTAEISKVSEVLMDSAKKLKEELPKLVYSNSENIVITGRMTFNGGLKANTANLSVVAGEKVNGVVWDEFLPNTLSYSADQDIEHDLSIDKIVTANFSTGSDISGADPGKWLLKMGGTLTGTVTFQDVIVESDVHVKDNTVNGIDLRNVLSKNQADIMVSGEKTFRQVTVQNETTAPFINEKNFTSWAEDVARSSIDSDLEFSGQAVIEGPIEIRGPLTCHFINNLEVPNITKLYVMKDTDQNITGHIHFKEDVEIKDAQIATLNGVEVNDLLTTSTSQVLQTGLNVTKMVVDGDITCPEIENLDFENLVFGDSQEDVISGPVHFENGVNILHLNVDQGTKLNNLDLASILNPETIIIDPEVSVISNAFIESLSTPSVNDFDVTNLEKRYWTKSGDQDIDVDLSVANTTRMGGNVTAETFLGQPMNQFLQTKSDERVYAAITFAGHVDVADRLTVRSDEGGIVIHGVNLQSLDDKVVKKVGQFQVRGTKIVQGLEILGKLMVNGTINGLNFTEDIALLDRPQTLSNASFENDVEIDDNVTVANGHVTVKKINDVAVDDFIAKALFVDDPAHIESLKFENDATVGDITVGNFNGVDIGNISRFGLRKDGRNQHNLTNLTINGNFTIEGLARTDSLNNYNISEVFSQIVNGSNLHFITGNKTTTTLKVDSSASFKTFNDRPLDFSKILSATKDQNVTGNFIVDNLAVDALKIESINGVNLSEFVKTTGTQEVQLINGQLNLDNMTIIGQLSIESRVLNNCSVPKLHEINTVRQFDSITIVNGSLILKNLSASNKILSDIVEKSVRTHQPTNITGKVEIDILGQNFTMGKLNISSGKLGNVDIDYLFANTMRKSTDQTIETPVRYADRIKVDILEKTNTFEFSKWNDDSVEQMLKEIVPKSGPRVISGKKKINGTWNVRNLNVTGLIDGVAVDQLVKTSDRAFPNGTSFSSLTVSQLISNGLIDGVNVTELVRERVPLSESSVINSSITFVANVSAGDVLVDKVNDLPFSELVLQISEPNQVISGKKTVQGSVNFQGDLIVHKVNDRIPEDAAVSLVENDKNAEFEFPVTFAGNLHVMENLAISNYESSPLSDQIIQAVDSERLLLNETDSEEDIFGGTILSALQKTPSNSFATFEYVESVQEVPLDLLGATSSILKLGASSISNSMSVVYVIRNSNGETCEQDETCRCYRTTVMSLDERGRPKTLRYPPRFREFIDSKQTGNNGAKIYVFHRGDWVIFVGSSIQKSNECSRDTVLIAALDSSTFDTRNEITVELDSFLSDAVLEQHPNGTIFLVISQSSHNILVFTFDAVSIELRQTIGMEGAIALDMTVVDRVANNPDSATILLAVAVPGLETNSSMWIYEEGEFREMQKLNTIGPMDVLITTTEDTIYVTFAQDPANVEQFGEAWSQYSVPAKVFRYSEASNRFEMFQKLDVDRVVSLANLNILGMPYMATASRISGVRIHRVVPGQGFQTEQTFQLPDVQSIIGYSIGDQAYISAVYKNKIQTFAARIRGLKKPVV